MQFHKQLQLLGEAHEEELAKLHHKHAAELWAVQEETRRLREQVVFLEAMLPKEYKGRVDLQEGSLSTSDIQLETTEDGADTNSTISGFHGNDFVPFERHGVGQSMPAFEIKGVVCRPAENMQCEGAKPHPNTVLPLSRSCSAKGETGTCADMNLLRKLTRNNSKTSSTTNRQRTRIAAEMNSDAKEKRARSNVTGHSGCNRKRNFWLGMHSRVYVLMLVGMAISLALLKRPRSGNWNDFGPRKTIKTGDEANCVLLAISRLAAYAMYPCLITVFISKCQFTRTHLFATQVSLYLRMEQGHHLHVFVGWWVFLLSWLHCIFHVIRWIRREEMHFIYRHQTGVTGLIACAASVLIVLPMGIRHLRRSVPWELRKHGHTVLGVTFGMSIALHAPATNVAWVCGSMVAVYGLDWLYVQFFKTFLVKSSHFHRLTDGVVMHFENPRGFNAPEGGYYLNLCVPFISKHQWHSLTVYPHPEQPSSSCVCIINNGDWSKALHADTKWHTKRPVWVQGPFLSPYAAVLHYDNAICVASGSGLTAALGALHSLRDDRRINLIWICRDPSMVEFYLNTISFDNNAFTMIFYTGKRPLMVHQQLPETTLVFEERPDIRDAICMIIHMIESGDFLPEELVDCCDRRRERMNRIAGELQDLVGSVSALETLERLLARAMQKYSIEELIRKLAVPADTCSEQDLDKLLVDVFNIQLSEDTVCELFEELAALGSGADMVSGKQKLIYFCKQAIDKYLDEGAEGSQDLTPHSLKGKVSLHQSSKELRHFLGDIPSSVTNKRMGRWSVCYCGGSAPVNKELTRVCKDFGIQYHHEGFEW